MTDSFFTPKEQRRALRELFTEVKNPAPNIERVRRILAAQPELANYINPQGETLLHAAGDARNARLAHMIFESMTDERALGSRSKKDDFTAAEIVHENGANTKMDDKRSNTWFVLHEKIMAKMGPVAQRSQPVEPTPPIVLVAKSPTKTVGRFAKPPEAAT